MCKFGLEITSVFSGTICPVQVAQYARYIHAEVIFNEEFEKYVVEVSKTFLSIQK